MLTKKVKNVSWRDWTLSGPWLLGLEREEEMMIDARFDLLYLCIPIGYSCGPAEYWSPVNCCFCSTTFVKNLTSDMERRGDLGSPGGRGWIGSTSPECWRVEGRESEMLMGRGEGMDG